MSYIDDLLEEASNALDRAALHGSFVFTWRDKSFTYQGEKLTREEAIRIIEDTTSLPPRQREAIFEAIRMGSAYKPDDWESSWSSSACY